MTSLHSGYEKNKRTVCSVVLLYGAHLLRVETIRTGTYPKKGTLEKILTGSSESMELGLLLRSGACTMHCRWSAIYEVVLPVLGFNIF